MNFERPLKPEPVRPYKLLKLLLPLSLLLVSTNSKAQHSPPKEKKEEGNFGGAAFDAEEQFKVADELSLKGKFKGGRLLFGAKAAESIQIFQLDLLSGTISRFGDGKGENSAPAISPDGQEVAFVSDRSGRQEIYLSDWTGNKIRQITKSSSQKSFPSWSSDGKRVLFVEESSSESSNISSIDIANKKIQKLTSYDQKNSTPVLLPTKEVIAYSTNRFWPGWDICLFDLTKKIENCVLSGSDSYVMPKFSSNGKQIAATHTMGVVSTISIMKIGQGSSPVDLKLRYNNSYPVWGSKDQSIFFLQKRKAGAPQHIYHYDLRRKKILDLVSSPFELEGLSWSPYSVDELKIGKLTKTLDSIKPTNTNSSKAESSYRPPYLKSGK